MRIRFTKNQTIEAMNKLTMIAVLLFISLTGFAQRGPGPAQNPEERAKRMTERLAETLELTVEQREAIYAIHLENATKRQAEFENRQQEREQLRSTMMQGQSQQREAIEKVLTPEQQKKWEELRAQQQATRGEGPRMQNRSGRPAEDGPRMRNRKGGTQKGGNEYRNGRKHDKNKQGTSVQDLNPIMN